MKEHGLTRLLCTGTNALYFPIRFAFCSYTSARSIALQLNTAKHPAFFEERHHAELTAYRAAAAYAGTDAPESLISPIFSKRLDIPGQFYIITSVNYLW